MEVRKEEKRKGLREKRELWRRWELPEEKEVTGMGKGAQLIFCFIPKL